MTLNMLCECSDKNCHRSVNLQERDLAEYDRHDTQMIVDGCPTGPDPGMVLAIRGDGYAIWRDGERKR